MEGIFAFAFLIKGIVVFLTISIEVQEEGMRVEEEFVQAKLVKPKLD